MRRQVPPHRSIFFKLNLFFLFTAAALIAFFVMAMREFRIEELHHIERKAVLDEARIREIFLKERQEAPRRFRELGYRLLEDPAAFPADITPIFIHPPSAFPTPVAQRIRDGRLRIYRDRDHLYFELIGPHQSKMVVTPLNLYRPRWLPLLFAGMFATLVLLYWTIRRNLRPLRRLAHQIHRFGEGEMEISTRSEGRDEIAFVANQFDLAVKKIRAMREARTLFMRNIMHELKTPITKGKLSLALMERGEEEAVLRRAFERMEQLIAEMAEMEMITSRTLDLDYDRCHLKQMVDSVSLLLFVDASRECVRYEGEEAWVHADCKMMTIVLKNLIDNGLKYSDDRCVRVRLEPERIEVINRGAPMARPFEELIEPFAKGALQPGVASFGLGLYIVKSILDAHGAALTYRYEEGHNLFTIRT